MRSGDDGQCPLPDRLRVESDTPLGRRQLVQLFCVGRACRVHVADEFDVATERDGAELPARPVPVVEPDQLGPKADGKGADADAAPAPDEVVAHFVDEHDDCQHEEERNDRCRPAGCLNQRAGQGNRSRQVLSQSAARRARILPTPMPANPWRTRVDQITPRSLWFYYPSDGKQHTWLGDPPPQAQPMRYRAKAAATSPSTRSMTPPWPGIRFPESLTPLRRLTQDSKRSPACETADRSERDENQANAETPTPAKTTRITPARRRPALRRSRRSRSCRAKSMAPALARRPPDRRNRQEISVAQTTAKRNRIAQNPAMSSSAQQRKRNAGQTRHRRDRRSPIVLHRVSAAATAGLPPQPRSAAEAPGRQRPRQWRPTQTSIKRSGRNPRLAAARGRDMRVHS